MLIYCHLFFHVMQNPVTIPFTILSHISILLLISITAIHPVHTHLQEGRLFQHAKEFWEIIPNLLINGTNQADLSHGPGSVCTVTVRLLHLQQEQMVHNIR